MTTVRCAFYVRTPADQGQFRYERFWVANRQGDGAIWTAHPPQVSDLISLWDDTKKDGGVYQVIDRHWLHTSWGSVNWPYNEREPKTGPTLEIIVEPAEGIFHNQAPSQEDDE